MIEFRVSNVTEEKKNTHTKKQGAYLEGYIHILCKCLRSPDVAPLIPLYFAK